MPAYNSGRHRVPDLKIERSFRDENIWTEIPVPEARKHLGKYYGNVNGILRDLTRRDVIYAGDFKFRAVDEEKPC